jgi:PIN domain nuclease of toxin-antitoxin system
VRLLLDSHTVLWALYEPAQLSPRAEELLADAANELFVSHVTMLEIANKLAAGRLPLAGGSVARMVERVEELEATFLPITLRTYSQPPSFRRTTPILWIESCSHKLRH